MNGSESSPALNPVGLSEISRAIREGVGDFKKAAPIDLVFGGLFAVAGWLLVALLVVFKLPFLAYPLAMGFALVAPFAAIAFYSVSDLIDKNSPLSFSAVLKRVMRSAKGDLRWMSLVTGFALVIWMDLAAFLFFAFVGLNGFNTDFFARLFTTPAGLAFLLAGNILGAAIAILVFSISAISFPLLFDRDIDFVTAMTTSVRLVKANPGPMLAWCALIGLSIAICVATGLVALLFVLPVIGHATFRLARIAAGPPAP